MKIEFTKMHGCGNDYIYVDCFNQQIPDVCKFAKVFSKRHFGIGADGVICLYPSKIADGKMEMYNADGSIGNMCGNGIRCIAKLLYDNNHIEKNKKEITIETKSGIKTLTPVYENSKIKTLTVDMGSPIFTPEEIPVDTSLLPYEFKSEIIYLPIKIKNLTYYCSCLSMGNPHCVTIVKNTAELNLKEIGPYFENNKLFPNRINTEFIQIIDNQTIKMRVWERGSGETLACGTGASAACAALCKLGKLKLNQNNTVKLLGGDLKINYTGKTVFMTGDATEVFKGYVEI